MDCDSQESIHFRDVDLQTGHTLVHYLYKGTYEAPDPDDETTPAHTCTKLRAALLVYIATNNHALPGLQHLATREIEEHGSGLDLVQVLNAIDGDFSKLCQDSWVHEYLRRKAKAAFEQDHTVFTDGALLQDLNNTALLKFLMQCALDLFHTKLSHVFSTEEKQRQEMDKQNQCAQNLSLDSTNPTLEEKEDSTAPPVDEMLTEQSCVAEVSDGMSSEGFCTISCPSSGSDHGVEDYSYDNTAGEDCEMPTTTVEDACYATCEVSVATLAEPEPQVPEDIPDAPQPDVCEPIWEGASEEITPLPADCPSVEYDAPSERQLEPAKYETPSQRTAKIRCWLQATHILQGDGLEHCRRCQETVERLAIKVRSQEI